MVKKLLLIFMLSIVLCSSAYARKITCDYENENTVSYHVYSDNNAHAGKIYLKQFVKYVDSNNNTEYWYKIGVEGVTRFMPYMDIIIDKNEYRLKQVENMQYRHLVAGADSDCVPKSGICYAIPENIISKIALTNTPITLVVHRQTVQGIVLKNDMTLTQDIQKIIGLSYYDKDQYLVKRDLRAKK